TRENVLEKGIDRVPAFFALSEHLLREPSGKYLQNLMDEWATAGFDAYNAKGGIVLTPRVNSEMLTEPCLSNVTTIQYFYSETCEYCKRVANNESEIVNPASNERFKYVVEEALPKIEQMFGDKISITKHCIPIHSRAENRITLGINKSDEELCVATQGIEKTNADSIIAAKYHVYTAPIFAVNCRYLFNAVTEEGIKKWICAAKPSLAPCKLAQSTAQPPRSNSQSPSAVAASETARVTATPAASPQPSA
ncbi:MAG: hypothetical protein QW343_01920, partial [Candidatus Norongarragalinales archaeon]